MRILQSLIALSFVAGFCAVMPASAITGRDTSPSTTNTNAGFQDPDGLFVRFGVAP